MAELKPFLRQNLQPALPPPNNSVGPIAWLRANLFSSPLNIILTFASLAAVVWLIAHLGPWFVNGVWDAGSLAECRKILDGKTGACFAVITDRWHQLLFGFYNPAHYWRPILAFILLPLAVAPIISPDVPRILLRLSVIYPFLAFWLLWGGSIWSPLMVLAGFGVAILAYRAALRMHWGSLVASLIAVAVILLWWSFIVSPLSALLAKWLPLGIATARSDMFGGFMVSTIIGVSGIALSLPLGIILALGRRSDMFLVRVLSIGFIEFVRGVPLIALLFTASLLLNYFLPPGSNFDIILRVIIMVTLFATAYMAEVIRGGLAALPRGQYEAADALGLDYWRAQRLVIMPQALKISIPNIVNTFIALFKDTTLVVFIGILDPIGLSNSIRADSNWNGIYWELFGFIGLCFFLFCYAMSRYSQALERRLKTDHH